MMNTSRFHGMWQPGWLLIFVVFALGAWPRGTLAQDAGGPAGPGTGGYGLGTTGAAPPPPVPSTGIYGAGVLIGGGQQSVAYPDQPKAYEPMPLPPNGRRISRGMQIFQAICWYLPNRLMDLTDIPRAYVAVGDGMGASLRATQFLTASWFEDNVFALGWTKRTPPFFGEQVQERFFGFLAAKEGSIRRDPTEVGLSVHFIWVGFNLAASGSEALDFLTGLAGVDLVGDDHGPVMIGDYVPRNPVKEELQRAVYGPQNAMPPVQATDPAGAPAPQAKPAASAPGVPVAPPVPPAKAKPAAPADEPAAPKAPEILYEAK